MRAAPHEDPVRRHGGPVARLEVGHVVTGHVQERGVVELRRRVGRAAGDVRGVQVDGRDVVGLAPVLLRSD